MKKINRTRGEGKPAVVSFSSSASLPLLSVLGPNNLPMHSGAVVAQYKRCGKPNCRCASGSLHGPYWYLVQRFGGRVKKTYLRPGSVEAARSACQEWRSFQAFLLNQRRETMRMYRDIRQIVRDARQERRELMKGYR